MGNLVPAASAATSTTPHSPDREFGEGPVKVLGDLKHTLANECTFLTVPCRPVAAQTMQPPSMVLLNRPLVKSLGLDPRVTSSAKGLLVFSGSVLAYGSRPVATAYAGHQFGTYTSVLGDGRALLLGEIEAPGYHKKRSFDPPVRGKAALVDIATKGSGRTPFSRHRSDGRCPLDAALREFLVSEYMHAINVPTTRSLACVQTGGSIFRRNTCVPGAVIVRTAKSFLRIGTFQYAATHCTRSQFRQLVDYARQRLYPKDETMLCFVKSVTRACALLVSDWMSAGFVHGVINTDNVAISGETLDYGPCAFLDHYDPNAVFSSIDTSGRYAYKNQPDVMRDNVVIWVRALLEGGIDFKMDTKALLRLVGDAFDDAYQRSWAANMTMKLGILTVTPESTKLVHTLLDLMESEKWDFTNTFRGLGDNERLPTPTTDANVAVVEQWMEDWRQLRCPRTYADVMDAFNPVVIPRNHVLQSVLSEATLKHNFYPLHTLYPILLGPHNSPTFNKYTASRFIDPPKPGTTPITTYCGT